MWGFFVANPVRIDTFEKNSAYVDAVQFAYLD